MPPLRVTTPLLCFIFTICYHYGAAQNEGTIWYLGGGEALDFTHAPPSALPFGGFSTTAGSGQGFATITKNGKVIAMSSGTYIGVPYEFTQAGDYLYGTSERQMFIPKPGSTTQYYFFYVGMLAWGRKDVMYCTIDIDANGSIKVLEKNVVLYAGLHGYFTLSAGCGGENYWLVGEADRNTTEGTDKIFSFRIDANGISNQVISTPLNMTESGGYRFSPDGTKLFFHFSGGTTTNGTAVADFDRFTGVVSNVNIIGPCCGFGEFSSNGKMLYVNYSEANEMDIVQYNLAQPVLTGDTIAHLPYHGTRFQIAIDGRIYIVLIDAADQSSLGIINNPNLSGLGANVQVTHPFLPITGMILMLPEFSTNIFYQSPYGAADAGEDKVVCVGDTILIGGQNAANQQYQWIPDQYLSNSKSPQTNFTFNNPITLSDTLHYVLKGLGDECVLSDTMTIVVHPRPMPSISGSPSVCPGVNSVLYYTEHDPSYIYNWSIEGGTIEGNANQDSIRVNWGDSDPNAMISLRVSNEFNCPAVPEKFPVRINVNLETQTPTGLTEVCYNLVENNIYQIDNTNGSIYTWGITGGTIDQGQGSNKLKVDWMTSGLHQLWVLEKSITKDTVCYGSSDTLNVKVYEDSLQILVHQVSVHPQNEIKARVWGELRNTPPSFSTPLTILRKDHHATDWQVIQELPVPENKQLFFEDNNLQTDNVVYDYQFKTINGCHLETFSDVQHTIRVEATAVEEDGKIMLQWNPYEGWSDPNLLYEIWRKIDFDTTFTFVKRTDLQTLDLLDGGKGFRHAIKVKAVSTHDTLYSWSNQIEVAFEHALFIPNIFTPTGDHLNETFTFEHIELYPENELVIYNRNSQEVYRQRNYDGSWSGDDLSSGIYYYYLRVFNAEKTESYKGWIQIMR